jgi:hypothetical protein
MGNEYPAPAEHQHCFLTVVGEQPVGLRHGAVQRSDVADVVAVYGMDRDTKLEGCTQGVNTDQVSVLRPVHLQLWPH